MFDDLLSLHAVGQWCHYIEDLAFWAEYPGRHSVPEGWEQSLRDDINFGCGLVNVWVRSRKGKPWPLDAPMSRAKLAATVSGLGHDALHLVTVLKSADCWGVRYSEWKCAADRALVDRVRNDVAAVKQLVELLTAAADDEPSGNTESERTRETTHPPKVAYLGVILNHQTRSVCRMIDQKTLGPVEFQRCPDQWALMRLLVQGGTDGVGREKIEGEITKHADKLKARLNDSIMVALRLEVQADRKGVWRLTEIVAPGAI